LNAYHLAGIVPVAGLSLDFKFDWHDSMMPVAPDYLAVERAVYECAWAGCETIWIVCNDDIGPLIKYRIGEWVQDPVWVGRRLDPYPSQTRKPIPIFYVPVRAKDIGKRDCLAWSVLHGAASAFETSARLSKWVIPRRNYVAFPYGVYNPEILREYRKTISSATPFMLSRDGKTVQDGEYLGFTFDKDDFVAARRIIREGTGKYNSEVLEAGLYPRKKLPKEERYSARYFSLDKIFKSVIIDIENKVEVPWYHNIDSWDGYCNYLGSEERKLVERPHPIFMKYREWNEIGVDNEE
jgi:hypothetical protein